jgi:3-oxoacyl-[acyl-carrier-protein] synthase III
MSKHQIGIDYCEFYLPGSFHSIDEYLKLEQRDFSLERMESIWTDFWFEPEVLYQHFSRQLSASASKPAGLTSEERDAFKLSNGISHVYCASAETSSDMAVEVGRRILARERGLAGKIDVVIYYHSTLNQIPMASTPCRLQHELELRNAYAFAVAEKGGNASLLSLKIACEMLAAEADINTILLIGSEKHVEPYKRTLGNITVRGDSASAMVVRRQSDRCHPLCLAVYDFPERWNSDKGDQYLNNFLADQAALILNETLAELNFEWSQIALVIPPNFSQFFVRLLGERLRISEKNIYSKNISRFGYLTTSDLVVNLVSASNEERIKSGDIVLAVTIDLDHSIGCVAFEL